MIGLKTVKDPGGEKGRELHDFFGSDPGTVGDVEQRYGNTKKVHTRLEARTEVGRGVFPEFLEEFDIITQVKSRRGGLLKDEQHLKNIHQ